MSKVMILKGLPASGKTTFSKSLVDLGWVRVNKDDLRSMLHNDKHSKSNENYILEVRDYIITTALMRGKNVVVDDTNLHPKHEKTIRDIVTFVKDVSNQREILVEVKEFDAPIEELIQRDKKRTKSVGEAVIKRMAKEKKEWAA